MIKIAMFAGSIIFAGWVIWVLSEGKDAIQSKDKLKLNGVGLVLSMGLNIIASILQPSMPVVILITLITLCFSVSAGYTLVSQKATFPQAR